MTKWTSTYCLWVARGFGVGRIPIAPGTFGSCLGLLWFALLLQTGSLWYYLLCTAAGFALSVWLCGEAEKILRAHDPGSVVLDEITAVPVCFLSFVAFPWLRNHTWPHVEDFFSGFGWRITILVFILFRLFDVLKPWPIRHSQKLPGGWGVTVDDFLAAICVALITIIWAC